MTVQASIGDVWAFQFGVNELASAYTVGKAVGSVFTRKNDSAIFPPLERQYQVFLRQIPQHLLGVTLARKGTILGENQRRIPVDNLLPDVELSTVTGVATFLILALRYVETKEDIGEYVQLLLRGKFGIICGGQLEGTDSEPAQQSLPYTVRQPFRSYISAVLDADADSKQHKSCLRWLSELSALVGKGRDSLSSSKYSRLENRRFIESLLGFGEHHSPHFHTLSSGVAMIALAALANGANISLTCASGNERKVVPAYYQRSTNAEPLAVTLWLTEPPENIARSMKAMFSPAQPLDGEQTTRSMPIYGGNAEVSRIMAKKLKFRVRDDEALLLLTNGLQLGEKASWETKLSQYHSDLTLRLSPRCMDVGGSALLDPLVKTCYSGRPNDIRHRLALKAAEAVDKVLQYSNYDRLNQGEAKNQMNLALIGFTIGCLKRLISNKPPKLETYALSIEELSNSDSMSLIELCINMADNGCSVEELMHAVGTIWGGLGWQNGTIPEGHWVGVVCPETTILLDIIQHPKSIAKDGIAHGIMSLHQGSTPIIPRDPVSGFVLAGDPNPDKIFAEINNLDFRRSPWSSSSRRKMPDAEIVFTIEPFLQANGSLSAILCGWLSGDVSFQLNPHVVFRNMVQRRRLNLTEEEKVHIGLKDLDVGRRTINVHDNRSFVYMSGFKLESLKCLRLSGVEAIIDVGSRVDWQIAAAGCVYPGTCIMVYDDDEIVQLSREDNLMELVGPESCVVLCRDL